MLGSRARFVKTVMMSIDVATICVAFVGSYWIRSMPVFDRFGQLHSLPTYLWVLWAALPVWLASMHYCGLHRPLDRLPIRQLFLRLGGSVLVAAVCLGAILYITRGVVVSRLFVHVFVVASFFLLLANRFLAKLLVWKSGRAVSLTPKALLIAPVEELDALADTLRGCSEWPGEVVGALTLSDRDDVSAQNSIRVMGSIEGLESALCSEVVDEVIFGVPSLNDPIPEHAIRLCENHGVTTRVVVSFGMDLTCARKTVETIGGNHALVSFESVPNATLGLVVKRGMDIVGGIIGALVFGLTYLFVAWPIKKSSPGPVLFKQERVGMNGRTFRLYKFRTMVVDAADQLDQLRERNEMNGAMFKMKDDPRVTDIGEFLRRTYIDEVPQFINVIKGEMSLVGTRPPTPDEVAKYKPHHHRRISFRPGITGLWQIRGNEEIPDFEDVVKLDTEYIDQWSLLLDLRIMLRTLGKVCRGVRRVARSESAGEAPRLYEERSRL